MRAWLTVAVILMAVAPADAQIPQSFSNLQHYPKDIAPAQLTQRMREFSLGLGVRCQVLPHRRRWRLVHGGRLRVG